ncbi:MAG: 2-oxo acid dehydrogenase subunit E2 [Actinobacteria bacterium]|jgi:pyruvate dehydrogenase E2 component (dihydrolipoamide acetyltransferase)|nr:MAG: 2-oxo acid dehydrogenase subunit E2 [Actinomycetota bacterium]
MATDVSLPRLGQGMEAGTIVRWLKSEGDTVEKGEPLYELDTDKVTQEVEADSSGVLLKILAGEGEEIEVGKRIAVIGEEGEEVEEEAPVEVDQDAQEEGSPAPAREEERERGREAAKEEERAASETARADGRIKASPLARRIARERGIELASLTGTGPEGRIVAEDVERAATAPAHATVGAAPLEAEIVPLTSLRKTIARRLTEAWQAPAFQISMSADMTRAQELRERLRDQGVTVTDVLTKLSAIALLRHREVNAQFADDELRIFPSAHIGLAVATERGLIVPVQRDVERKSLVQIASERKEIVHRTREGKLSQEDLEGGTFTISNLGMYGVEIFTAVLNPPQAAILAVGAIEERPVVEHGDFVARPLIAMTLTCDHRAVDGAKAAEFLRELKMLLEEPGLAL